MQTVLKIFERISQIPRPSNNEEQIRAFLLDISNRLHELFEPHQIPNIQLVSRQDSAWNVLIKVPATPWREWDETKMVQAHMDMVAVKEKGHSHDFEKHPIDLRITDEHITANGTTLWADNGIGLALALSTIAYESRPPLEILITSREEIGLLWASELDVVWLGIEAKRIINLDSEDLWRISVASAWWVRLEANGDVEMVTPKISNQFHIRLFGMWGWHSGVEIHKNRGNLVYEFIQFLQKIAWEWEDIEIVSINSWEFAIDNAIPSALDVVLGLADEERLRLLLERFAWEMKSKYNDAEDFSFSLVQSTTNADVVNQESLKNTFWFINGNKVNVHKWSQDIDWLVQTSNNLSYISVENGRFECTYLARSSDDRDLDEIISSISEASKKGNIQVTTGSKIPSWVEPLDGEFLTRVKSVYWEILGEEVILEWLHAALEAGALANVMEKALWYRPQVVSYWPTITWAHTTQETLHLATLQVVIDVTRKLITEKLY